MILAPDARNRFAPDAYNNATCPIWSGLKVGDTRYPPEKNVHDGGSRYYSSRAGGPFLLMPPGAGLLALDSWDDEQKSLTIRQKVNLSYWIYQHSLEYRLLDELSSQVLQELVWFELWMNDRRDRVLKLDKDWVEGHRDREPSAEDRMLNFLRESIRDWDADPEERQLTSDLKMAAGGCRTETDLDELENHAAEQGWMGVPTDNGVNRFTNRVNLPARMYVEERTRVLDERRQGFVARWFDCSMDPMYEEGIALAIRDAGYEPRLINDRGFTGGVVDQILAEIRKSKFVVADFTSCGKCTACEKCKHIGARGGVYFEAGFALGLGKTVFLTCRKDRTEAVHFDVNHLNRIEWETPEDLREDLKNSILAVLDRGPLDPLDSQLTDSRQPERPSA